MNLSMCPSTHPFVSSRQLEDEGNKLLEESTSLLFASKWVANFLDHVA